MLELLVYRSQRRSMAIVGLNRRAHSLKRINPSPAKLNQYSCTEIPRSMMARINPMKYVAGMSMLIHWKNLGIVSIGKIKPEKNTAVSIEHDYRYVAHHPLAETDQFYSPPPHERPTWDLPSALYAMQPDRGSFGLPEGGRRVHALHAAAKWPRLFSQTRGDATRPRPRGARSTLHPAAETNRQMKLNSPIEFADREFK